jgi:large subunit ribosomal protein L17
MNHKNGRNRFSRTTSHCEAMFRNMCISLIREEQIKTTLPKAKALRKVLEPLITKAKKSDDVQTRRYLISRLTNKDAVEKLLKVVGPKNEKRPGGYLRILKCGQRVGDAAPMAYVQLVGFERIGGA